jgi:type I restriction enzyme, S subunit
VVIKGEVIEVRDASPRYAPEVDIPVVPNGYKETDVGSIPEVWECVPIASLGDGKVPPVKAGPFGSSITKSQYVSSGYKVYGQEQVIRGDYLYGDYFISARKYRELESCAVRPGDILLSLVGTLGKLLEIPDEAPQGVINPRLLRLSLDRQRILPRFLKYLFESEGVQTRLERQAQGGTMGVLNASVFQRFRIALPPLKEQRAIATALSDVDALLEALDRLIGKKRDIKQATMQQLLTAQTRLPGFNDEWQMVRLGDVCEVSIGRTPSRLNQAFWGRGYTWLSIADLQSKVVSESKEQITDLAASTMSIIPKGTLLMSFKLSIGRLCFAGCDLFTNEAICAFRKLEAHPAFLYYALSRVDFALYGKQAVKGYTLNKESLKIVEVPFPSGAEQTAIATVLSDMDAELEALQLRRAKTAALKQAMMQELLTGRTRLMDLFSKERAND